MEPSTNARLRLALLGADETTPAVVRAILDSRQFDLAGVCEFDLASDDPALSRLRETLGRVPRIDPWTALLDPNFVNAVIVARGHDDDQGAERLRKLIQVGVPVLASHPVADSMLVYYELDMIRRETNSVVLPLLAERHHPAIVELATLARQGADSPIGRAEQIVFERNILRPTKQRVADQFARDVNIVRAIGGDMTRLGAMASGGEQPYTSLGVQLSGPAGLVARWSVTSIPVADAAPSRCWARAAARPSSCQPAESRTNWSS